MSVNYLESKPASMDVVAPRNEQPVQMGEWQGHTSSKFGGEKAHVPHPKVDQSQPHPLYSMGGRQHFEKQNQASNSNFEWKSTMRVGIQPEIKEPRKEAVKHIDFKPGAVKPTPERAHLRDQFESMQGPTMDNANFVMKRFEQANEASTTEWNTEKQMTQKHRVKTLYDQRNGLPLTSLGDKNYKHPEYQPQFFKEGGLIVGSTNKLRMASGGSGKAIDFYSGLKLDQGPLNPNRKTWAQTVKEQQLNEELDAVGSLKDWERGTLKEVDPNYEVDDDSDEEGKEKPKEEEAS